MRKVLGIAAILIPLCTACVDGGMVDGKKFEYNTSFAYNPSESTCEVKYAPYTYNEATLGSGIPFVDTAHNNRAHCFESCSELGKLRRDCQPYDKDYFSPVFNKETSVGIVYACSEVDGQKAYVPVKYVDCSELGCGGCIFTTNEEKDRMTP